ncbi:MAG: ATPase [Candidatus Margulisbacteria bacterium GWF2_35_9]|nr:MAG: ATPase [Candidatus Margulisbacteria bacterium GWF2_35_9]
MIKRDRYINELIGFKDKQLIKVITGIRRGGKSTLLNIFQTYLLKNNVNPNQIITINFENPDFEELQDYKNLYKYIENRLTKDKKNYVFLDEIQNVTDYQKAVDGLYIKENVDIYITGSNAYFLSGELATLLSGRYIEIKILPLSFQEYLSAFSEQSDLPTRYKNYLVNSSFPYTIELDSKQIGIYLDGIYNTVILKDVVARKNISDVAVLESVVKYMFDNIGNITSIKKISDSLTSAGRKVSNHTVENYISALLDSFILYKASRYDIKGKQYLKTNEKYYAVDVGLRYFLLGTKKTDMGRILENIVYLELIRRGYDVYVGKVGILEVDFVALKDGNVEYYQVAQTVQHEDTLRRELESLNNIKDHNPKYLLTLDNEPASSHNGIKQIYALDWLVQS